VVRSMGTAGEGEEMAVAARVLAACSTVQASMSMAGAPLGGAFRLRAMIGGPVGGSSS